MLWQLPGLFAALRGVNPGLKPKTVFIITCLVAVQTFGYFIESRYSLLSCQNLNFESFSNIHVKRIH